MTALRVHLLDKPQPDELADLHRQLDRNVEVTTGPDLPQPARFDTLVGGRPRPAHLEASPRLRALIIPFAGVPEATQALLRDYPQLAVHNLHHNAAATAEMALALLLAAAKLIVPADRALRRGDWTVRYQPSPSIPLEGRTALIVGYGAIGYRVARGCAALGMRVLGVRRQSAEPAHSPEGVAVYPASALRDLLPRAQALVLTLPLTPATRGLIDADALAWLPHDAILVNVARAAVVDEAALYAALEAGRLRAGLDVWYQYPADEAARANTPPSRFPFHALDNVVLSPHRAGSASDGERQRLAALAALLNAAARGEPMPNRVDPTAGY